MAKVSGAVQIKTRIKHDLLLPFQSVAGDRSLNVGTLLCPSKIHGPKDAVLFHPKFGWLGDAIETKVILGHIDFGKQFALKRFAARVIDFAFKHRFLNALADSLARAGNPTQSPAPGGRFR